MGDLDLLQHESSRKENLKQSLIFLIVTSVLCFMTCICCYIMYSFREEVAKSLLIMLGIALLFEKLVTRVLCTVVLSLFYICKRKSVKKDRERERVAFMS